MPLTTRVHKFFAALEASMGALPTLYYQSFCHDIDSAFVCSHHFCLSVARSRRYIYPGMGVRPAPPINLPTRTLSMMDVTSKFVFTRSYASMRYHTFYWKPFLSTALIVLDVVDLMNYLLCYPSSRAMFMWVAYPLLKEMYWWILWVDLFCLFLKKLCNGLRHFNYYFLRVVSLLNNIAWSRLFCNK